MRAGRKAVGRSQEGGGSIAVTRTVAGCCAMKFYSVRNVVSDCVHVMQIVYHTIFIAVK